MKNFSKKFKNLIDFIQFTHEFREIIRISRSPHAKHFENDTEHSYQLAMVAWYIIETDKLKLNKELCLMYALAHDLVEVYAGDTYIFDKNKNNHESKKRREKESLIKISKRFPKFKTLIKIISKYEEKNDIESKFIYALDKIIPPIQICLEDGKLWHEKDVSLNEIMENKNPKIAMSESINEYWKELSRYISKRHKKLFPR